jgi:DNA-binding CsgD family transcriptional regulator
MNTGLKEFSDLVELIYRAGVNPAHWRSVLNALSKAFECASGLLHRYDPHLGSVLAFEEFGHDPTFSKAYVQHYAAINPYPAESFHRLATGKVHFAGTLLPVQEVLGTEFYNDWMKPQGISANHLGVVLSRSGGVMSLLCVAPQARVFDKNPKRFGDRLQMLVPHMAKALELNRALASAALAHETSNAMLDAIPAAVYLLTGGSTILFANRRGEELLRNEQVLAVDAVTRKLRPFCFSEGKRFEGAIAKANLERQPQFMRLVAGETGAAFILAVVPLALRETDGLPMSLREGIAIIVTPSSGHVDLRIEDIRAATGLSQAEARLAKALVSGSTTIEYAEAAGLSANTVRRQLASTFLKTETNKQSELIAMLIRTMGMASKT